MDRGVMEVMADTAGMVVMEVMEVMVDMEVMAVDMEVMAVDMADMVGDVAVITTVDHIMVDMVATDIFNQKI